MKFDVKYHKGMMLKKVLLYFFSCFLNIHRWLFQVVSAEILMASESGCPIEMHKIPIEKCDDMFDEECAGNKFMPFHRANYDKKTGQSPNTPREQQNSMTSWIDASFVYSTKVSRSTTSID